MIMIGLSLRTTPTPTPEVVADREAEVKEKPKVVVEQPKREPLDGTKLGDLIVNWKDDVPFRMALTPDARQLVVSGLKSVGVWQLPEAAFLGQFEMVTRNTAFTVSQDGSTVVMGAMGTGMFRARDLASNTQIWESALPGSRAWSATYLPDGKRILVTNANPNLARILDAKSGRELFRFEIGEAPFVHVSKDGTKVLFPSIQSNEVELYEINTGKRLQVVNTQEDLRTVLMTADGKTAIVGGGPWKVGPHGWVSAYDLATNKQIQQFGKGEGLTTLHMLAISPNEQYVAGCTSGKEIYLWETKTGKLIAKYDHQRGPGMGIAFSPDSKRIISTTQDKTVRSWLVARNLPDTPENSPQKPKRTLLARLDAASFPEFRHLITMNKRKHLLPPNNAAVQWTAGTWQAGAEGEVLAQRLDGRNVLRMRNVKGNSLQIYSTKPICTQRAGMRYTLQMRYQLDRAGLTRVELRKGSTPEDRLRDARCNATKNGFEMLEMQIDGVEDLPLQVFIVHFTGGGALLDIDSIDIYEESML